MKEKSFENTKIPALVLEGGAMRGMYTAGVLDTFLEMGLEADNVIGVSAGALFGVNYLSKQKGRVIRYNKKYNSDKDYLGLRPLLKEGNIVSTEYAYERVPLKLDPFDDETYKRSKANFYAVVTNIENGQAEYHRIDSVFDQMDILRASGSMPFVSKIVEISGKKYLDGAVADSIPFQWMAANCPDVKAEKLVVVLTRDQSYRKKAISPFFANRYKKKYPHLAEKIANRHNLYNGQLQTLKEWEEKGKAFVIRPSKPIEIGKIEKNPDRLQSVYDLGVKDARDSMDRLKAYLLNDSIGLKSLESPGL